MHGRSANCEHSRLLNVNHLERARFLLDRYRYTLACRAYHACHCRYSLLNAGHLDLAGLDFFGLSDYLK
jgi:hypothetical protein